ncbi:MAG TPA: isoprenylcysteine carboxylmethyltransferase family protein [Anaerolineales bacterium]|nr:isoprenylcysteine carboxylmethyltransferase family protein [Anaerolineales bacterium]
MYQWIIFIAGSLLILAISWKSLRQPGSHGFYRFFAWEIILALFAINMKFWFYKPFSWNQIIAWFLLIVACIPLAFGVQALRTRGKPTEQRAGDPSLLAFEKTTELVTSGIYHYIRHPLYSSLFLLTWGIFFKSPSFIGMVLAVAATLSLIATAKADEAECTRFFGPRYQDYMKHTKRFVPYVF